MDLTKVFLAAEEVQTIARAQRWQSCVIGGLAVFRWGEPRFTQDADLTLLTGFGNEEAFVDHLLKHLLPRSSNAREFALARRVLLVRTASGISVDIALAGLPFEERAVARASAWEFQAGHSVTLCSAEDLVVYKAFAGRDRDWADVEMILARQFERLNFKQIREELQPLVELKEAPELLVKLDAMVQRVTRQLRK